MDYMRQAIAILFVAAIIALIAYTPVFIYIKKKNKVVGWNRHLQRRYFEPLREVAVISPEAAVEKAKRGGYEHEYTDMILDSVELDYEVDRVKGHLLPVYKLSGTAKAADGSEENWSTSIPAMKN